MESKKIVLRYTLITSLIIFAVFSRVIPHPPNFAPIGAIALFGAAYYSQRIFSFIIPIIAMWLSDLFINNVIYGQYFEHFVWFYDGFYWTYGAIAVIVAFGFLVIKQVKTKNILLASIVASITFYLISNFGVWFSSTMYSKTSEGLISCYIAGLPFLKNTISGDFIYSILLFGIFNLAQKQFPVLQLQKTN